MICEEFLGSQSGMDKKRFKVFLSGKNEDLNLGILLCVNILEDMHI